MNALTLALLATAAAPAPAAAPQPEAHGAGFSALLGEMTDPKSTSAAPDKDTNPADATEAAEATQAPALSPLQSLQAALAAFGGFPAPASSAPLRAATPGQDASAPRNTAAASDGAGAASLSAALTTAASAFDGAGGGGAKPLKTILQADPTLGVGEFAMKTFLAASGATPLRAGPQTLGVDAGWSPLALNQKAAAAGALPAPAAHGVGATAAPAATRAAADRHAAPLAGQSGEASEIAGAAPASSPAPRRDDDDKASVAAVAATTDAAPAASPNAGQVVPVPLAELPAFIATQASALAASAPAEAQSSASGAEAPAKAAQAVKELQISLDPAELGPMTLKLRLAGGKLSVTIAVANPQTLASIEDDRSLIAARLAGVDQSLEDLVIQRQTAAPQEPASAHAPASTSSEGQSRPDLAEGEAGASRRRGARPGGGFGGFV